MIGTLLGKLRSLTGRSLDDRGQAMIEYALILCLVVIVILVTLIVLGNQVRNTYCNIAGAVVNA